MGGDSYSPPLSSTAEEPLLEQDFSRKSIHSSVFRGEDGLSRELENGSMINPEIGLNFGEFADVVPRSSLISETVERQRLKVYAEVLRSYEQLQSRIDRLEEAKSKILSYTPGSWAEMSGMTLNECYEPPTTAFLLIGPKGSGKSSLVNKISRVFEDDMFVSGRAQVSCNSSIGDGTCFLHEYTIPRGSSSFCLYDTRSLLGDSSENLKMLKRWMTKGVRHGELVKRKSDSLDLKARLNWKARSWSSSPRRIINFVIFVVNGISVLESMDSVDEKKKKYWQMIASTFNNPLLSFKDDKPVVVVTHGDLLSLSNRARVCVFLGELLGVPATSQIFDIPESNDSVTTLAIFDMLIYCLEHAERNLPMIPPFRSKAPSMAFIVFCVVVIAAILVGISLNHPVRAAHNAPPSMQVEWRKIRHLWSGEDDD